MAEWAKPKGKRMARNGNGRARPGGIKEENRFQELADDDVPPELGDSEDEASDNNRNQNPVEILSSSEESLSDSDFDYLVSVSDYCVGIPVIFIPSLTGTLNS